MIHFYRAKCSALSAPTHLPNHLFTSTKNFEGGHDLCRWYFIEDVAAFTAEDAVIQLPVEFSPPELTVKFEAIRCMRHPPVFTYYSSPGSQFEQPRVDNTDWCGEYQNDG